MIKLGFGGDSETTAQAALRSFADELLALLVELRAEYQDIGDAEILATLDDRRRELETADAETIPALAGSCLVAAWTAVKQARDRQTEQHDEVARFAALVRDAVTGIGSEGDGPTAEVKDLAEGFTAPPAIRDGSQLNALLAQESQHLHRLAAERRKMSCRATATFMVRVASLERQLLRARFTLGL